MDEAFFAEYEDYPYIIDDNVPGIYLHVPFCDTKCPYCNFYSVKADEEVMDLYTAKMLAAMEGAAARWPIKADTLYFGGGTPILLGTKRIETLILKARELFGLNGGEITVEANPCDKLEDTLCRLFAAGVNRLSLGMQSSDDEELRLLGRRHTARDTFSAVRAAQKAGFTNISLDLMLGIPEQTAQTVIQSVDFCHECGVSHVSAYLLSIEPDTPLAKSSLRLLCADEDLQAELYLCALDRLKLRGFYQYEISNFARPGFHSRHNCKYWLGCDYLGLGPSAHSLVWGNRLFFPNDLKRFLVSPDPIELIENEGAGNDAQEYVFLRLRLNQGICEEDARREFLSFDWNNFFKNADEMIRAGFMNKKNGRLFFTPRGFLLSNNILARILP